MKNFVIAIILIAVLGGVLYFTPRTTKAPSNNDQDQQDQGPVVTDFFSCAAAGYPVQESYPAVCRTPDGKMFSETINADVIVITPQIAQIVTSPMEVKARVRGTWFFEANLPIELQDENGNVLAKKGYMTTDNWMTTDYLEVVTTLSFKAPKTDYGKFIIKKDNPSGDPEQDQLFEVPVRFK